MSEINIDNFVISHMSQESNDRTRERLQQLIDIGCTENGIGCFGYEGVVSGLYIERVWNMTNSAWDEYIEWMQGLIDENSKKWDPSKLKLIALGIPKKLKKQVIKSAEKKKISTSQYICEILEKHESKNK